MRQRSRRGKGTRVTIESYRATAVGGLRRVAWLAVAVATSLYATPLAASAGQSKGDYYVSGPNLALAAHGGHAEVSSQLDAFPHDALNDGIRQSIGYWNDGTNGQFPDWAQIVWADRVTVDQIVLRMPVADYLTQISRTLGPVEVSRWDAASGSWSAIVPTNGTDNPIATLTAPATADGSQITILNFDPVETSKIRVTFLGGNSDGWSFLEEIEAYDRELARAPYRVTSVDNSSDSILQPNDTANVRTRVTDSRGFNVADYPVTFSERTRKGGEVLGIDQDPTKPGIQVRTDMSGEAKTAVRLGPKVGMNLFVASGETGGRKAVFRLRALALEAALRKSTQWLEGQAEILETGSRITATDGTTMYTPDGVGGYPTFYVRDFAYMVENYPAGLPSQDIHDGFEYLIRGQRADGAMPDRVAADGSPQYLVAGTEPPTDNPQFMVKLAHEYWQITGDLSQFRAHSGDLVRGMEFVPRSPDNSLVYIDPKNPHSPYGFTDRIEKTGDLLFSSLLYYEAADNLSDLFAAIDDDSAAERWRAEADRLKQDVQTLYDPDSGMFLAASVDNRQIDIWGSAYASFLGVATDSQQLGVAHYLKDNYDGIVRDGQVRHTAPGTFWERTPTPAGLFQNGPYWATSSGWVAATIARIDRRLAQQMLVDMTKHFRANGIDEYFNDDPQLVGVRKYVVSATNPIPVMNDLLGVTRR